MEVTNDADGEIDDVNMVSLPDNNSAAQSEPANKRPTRAAQGARTARDTSVDMTSVEDARTTSSEAPRQTPTINFSHNPSDEQRAPLPPLEEQIRRITELVQGMDLEEGAKGYIISNEWLQDVQLGRTKSCAQQSVDNRVFLQEGDFDLKDEKGEKFYPMKPGLTVGQEIELLPEKAWEQVVEWYGKVPECPTVIRYCHNTSSGIGSENLQFELYPPVFTIVKLKDPTSPPTQVETTSAAIKLLASRHKPFQEFLKEAKEATRIDMARKVRVWRILDTHSAASHQTIGMITPAQSREGSPQRDGDVPSSNIGRGLILDLSAFISLDYGSQRESLDAKDETANTKYNGKSNLDQNGLGQEGLIVLEEQIGGPAGGEWVSDASASSAKKGSASNFLSANSASGKPKSNTSSGRTSPAPQGMMTRGRAQKNGRTRGTVGLSNLGNTCYMNSALQCVRSVKELTEYFLEDKFKKELNPSNPLAHNGEVAKAYAGLLKEIYNGGSISSFSPRHFKQVIGKYGPSFSGYGQQDSQEFLLFLLDGLQEDLNRIHKKPYIEKPDSTDEMVHDKAALSKFADDCWDIYKARNDSVITDLFAGMYKSTVTCPVCDKVSIIFDPFNNLTLQLPVENMWSRTLTFYPVNLPPVNIHIEIDKNSTFGELVQLIGTKVSVDPKRLIIAEIYNNRFYEVFDLAVVLSEKRIQINDYIVVIEVEDTPTNYPPPKRKKQRSFSFSNMDDDEEEDESLSDRLLVPIFHRHPAPASRGGSLEQMALFGDPSYIILNKEEAKDSDLILKKVLARVAIMTSTDILDEGKEQASEEDSDMVVMNNDTDSSSDSKVQASSVQGEEGMVDISMKDSDDSAEAPHRSYPPAPKIKKSLPPMLHPDAYLNPQTRSFFTMKYWKGNEILPTAWNSLGSESRQLPSLQSRIPKKLSAGEKLRGALKDNKFGEEDEELENSYTRTSSSRRSSVASDEDDGLPPVEQLYGTNNSSSNVTSNKSAGFWESQEPESDVLQTKSEEPLIRLGEALVLDWDSRFYDSLFGGTSTDDMRGFSIWDQKRPLLPDPEQEAKTLLRKRRQKNGVTLDDCLDEFGKEETLSENDAWYCPRCKEHRRASKKFELWKVPDVLVIHLKRFSAQGRFRDKLDLVVDFPIEELDLSNRVVVQEDGKELIYDLFAVDNHYGGLGGGHYTAIAQNFNDGNWYDYNDGSASKKHDPQSAVTSAAYLLFYRRRSSKPLGGLFFEKFYGELDSPSESASRSQSPSSQSGEGQRLDGSSRNGLSSAFHEAGAVHRAGGGGSGVEQVPQRALDEDDEEQPPAYSDFHQDTIMASTEGDDVLDYMGGGPTWTFGNYGRGDDDARSVGSNSSTAVHQDDDQLMHSYDSISGGHPTGGKPGTPEGSLSLAGDIDDQLLLPSVSHDRSTMAQASVDRELEMLRSDQAAGMQDDEPVANIVLDDENEPEGVTLMK